MTLNLIIVVMTMVLVIKYCRCLYMLMIQLQTFKHINTTPVNLNKQLAISSKVS